MVVPLHRLCEAAGYWPELEHADVNAVPEHPGQTLWRHVREVCWKSAGTGT